MIEPIDDRAGERGDSRMGMQSVMRLVTEKEQAEGKVAELRKAMRQWAQMVHQGYHTDQPGTWQDCPKSICAHAREIVAE